MFYFVAETGNTSRQETVSMIPPLVLDVKPHHKVGFIREETVSMIPPLVLDVKPHHKVGFIREENV